MSKKLLPRFINQIVVVLLTGISLTNSTALAAAPAGPRHDDTNVILISLQCLRPDHLGAYGYKRGTSRNIDRLASQSVLFENAISQANLTPVAQMSVLTSQYPRINGMVSFEVAKDQVSQRTLPEILKMYGYTTAATVSSPEFFLRYDGATGVTVNPGDLFSRSFDHFSRTRKGPDGRSVRKVPTEALQWLKNNHDRKFFLWIASGLIHMPYGAAVPAAYRRMYDPAGYVPFWKRLAEAPAWKELGEDPDYDVFSRIYRGEFYWGFSPIYRLTDTDIDYVNGRYDAGVYYTDLFIGELLKLLDSLKLTEKTVIILQSIHGEDLGERGGNFFHYDVTDTIIKNALMIRFPGQDQGGRRVAEQVQAIDIMPTLLDYLQIPVPHEAQGMSLMPFLHGDRTAAPGEFAYIDRLPWWEYTLDKWYLEFKRSQGAPFASAELEKLPAYRNLLAQSFTELGYPPGDIAIRSNDWKLILRKNRNLLRKVSWQGFLAGREPEIPEVELYDLKNDPGETTNVALANPEVVARLREKLLTWDREMERGKKAFNPDDKRLVIPYP
jgi:arylsulfatase A-like enzyme